MFSLFKVNFPWAFYAVVMILIRLCFMDMTWYSFFALCIAVHQFLLLFYAVGSIIPIRYLAGAFMSLQMLLGPTFAYNGLDEYQRANYQMKIPEDQYFSYIIPAIILFIIGLHITAGRLKGERLNQKSIAYFVDRSGSLPYYFIGVGFVSSIVSNFFGAELGFVFYLLGSFKFIGGFMLILGTKKLKIGILVVVFGSIVISSLGKAMFHDLLTWMVMLGAVLAIRFKPSIKIKVIGATTFILIAVLIQQLKSDYRKVAWGGGEAGLETLEDVYDEKQADNSLLSYESLAKSNIRINQGFIVTNIMSNVPANVPFENGAEMLQIFEAAFLPRILAPDKLNAGDRDIFMKYSGLRLQKGTSMGLSSMGDAYINFGTIGGGIFMFFLGLIFSEVLNGFYKYSKFFPVLLLFTPLVFYYPIRPDCELQTSLGHLFKSCFLVFVVIQIWKYTFREKRIVVT